MKLYLIYATIDEAIYNSRIKYLISNVHDYRCKEKFFVGLYAWTTSKKILKDFMDVRDKSIYTIKKKDDVDEEFIHHIKSKVGELELKPYKYYLTDDKSDKESMIIISTKNEYICTTVDTKQYLLDFGPQPYADMDYEIFSNKIQKALDKLGYTKLYKMEYGTPNDVDYIYYNESYGISVLGQSIKNIDNQVNILIYLFRYLFYGNPNTKEESSE